MKATGPLAHIKKTAKRIKKENPHIKLMEVQHDLAQYLGFLKWDDLLLADDATLQKRINFKNIDKL